MASATTKYLLYIDILGFSDLVGKDPARVAQVYGILNSLNVHAHKVFRALAFSDTVLVYNIEEPRTAEDHAYMVMYSIEFAQDLHHRLIGQGIYFRAILLNGDFRHYRLSNIDCFFGSALIDAYRQEKTIPSLGLFIDSACNNYNRHFRTAPFSGDLHFVYLAQTLERFQEHTQGILPLTGYDAFDDAYGDLAAQVRFLQDVHKNMRECPDASVRAKFLTAWDFYFRRYSKILSVLADGDFQLAVLSPSHDWSNQIRVLEANITEVSKLGSRM